MSETDPVESAGSPGRAAGLSATVLGLIASGVLVNVLLAVVARSVSPSDYAIFSAFWSVALIAGFGVFLPVEQWLAQRLPWSTDPAAEMASTGRLVALLVAVELVLTVPVAVVLFRTLGSGLAMWAALAVLCLVSGAQFLVRGYLIGSDRLGAFAAVLTLDVVIRVLVALALSAAQVSSVPPYAWAVVAGLGLAHVPVLVLLRGRLVTLGAGRLATPLRPVLLLLIGSLGAQVLLNAPTVVLAAVADPAQLPEVGSFQAAFQLVRVPLFLAVPMQATLVPLLVHVLHGVTIRERATLLVRFTLGVAAVVVAGVALGWFAGPWLVRLVFGSQYDAAAGVVAVLAAGAGAYLGLLVLTQVFVAERRHATVGTSWGLGVAVAAVLFVLISHPLTAAATSFTGGCAAALCWALVAAARTSRGTSTTIETALS